MSDIRYYTDGTQATAANLNKPLEDLEKQSQYMSQAQFEANADMRRNAYAGSGYVSLAKSAWAGDVYEAFGGFDSNAGLSTINRHTLIKSPDNHKNSLIFDWNNQYNKKSHRSYFNFNGYNVAFVAPMSSDTFGSTGKAKFPDAPTKWYRARYCFKNKRL